MDDSFSIFSLESNPYGLSYGQWSAKWWQWLLSIPKPSSPALDHTGANANINQNERNVFFLCQTYEGAETFPNRTVNLPKGRSIFMPIINWVSILHYDGDTDEELVATAHKRMKQITNLEITINGATLDEELEKYMVQSPFFQVMLPQNNILELPAGSKRCISDGYWIFSKPLSKRTKITSFGSCSLGATKIGVHYEVKIAE